MRLLVIDHHCPGDTLEDTAAVRDLCWSHPGLRVNVDTTAPELWNGCRYLDRTVTRANADKILPVEQPLINAANSCGIHVIHAIERHLEDALGLRIRPGDLRADIHLSRDERLDDAWFDSFGVWRGGYWLVNAGHKADVPSKFWGTRHFQEVIDLTRHRISWVQVGAAGDHHEPLEGVISLIGRTSLRDICRLMYRAAGVLTPVSMLMHLSTMPWCGHPDDVRRPCVVIAGGREPDSWTAYPGHRRFSSHGLLPCSLRNGCWRNATTASPCLSLTPEGLPSCLALIRPADVANTILQLDNVQHPH